MRDLKKLGWVRLHRKIEENPLWFLESFTKAQAWIDLFLNANHKDGIIDIRGNILKIKRGQIGWSELTMAKRWSWSKNKVRRFLNWLETEQQIKQQKSNLTTIITILNYEEHQNDDTADDTTERPQKDSRRYTNKNDKNDKNILSTKVDNKSKAPDKRNPDIETIYSLFEKHLGIRPKPIKAKNGFDLNRGACHRLIKQHGVKSLSKMLLLVFQHQSKDRYCRTSTNPLEFEKNLAWYKTYFDKKRAEQVKAQEGNNITF